jgi:hypothetical protein
MMVSKLPRTPKTPENAFSDAEIPDDDPRDGDFVMDIVDNEMKFMVNTMDGFHGQTGEGFYGQTGEGFGLDGKGVECEGEYVDEEGEGVGGGGEEEEEDQVQAEGCVTGENEDLLR